MNIDEAARTLPNRFQDPEPESVRFGEFAGTRPAAQKFEPARRSPRYSAHMTQDLAVALSTLAMTVAGLGQASAQTATAPQAIQEEAFVRIGGIDQWISIRGQNAENPVVLLLHGGPGFPNAPFTPAFVSWQKDFTLVDWDQRGAGRTFGRNGAEGSGPLSIERLTQDGLGSRST